jgi:hypothetical protein
MTVRPTLPAHRRGLLALATMALLASAAMLPAAAVGHLPGHYFLRAHRAIRFRVHGAHGYVIGVAEGSPRHFTVTARRGPATTEYDTRSIHPQTSGRFDVRGKVGELGSSDVHFTPRGKPRRFPRYRWCSGPGPTIQPGTVRGEIRFRGERGYTRVVAHIARAELETVPGQRCHYGESGHSKNPPRYTATFDANHETGGPGTHFEALRFAPGSRPPARRVFFQASDYEQLGSVRVVRQVRLATTTATFLLPNFATAPENAVIRPPAPFTGSATFARTPESTFTWTGDLAVRFPGIDPLPLAGPGFRLHYCALHSCIDQESPEEREESP